MGSKILLQIRWRQARKELKGAGAMYGVVLLLLACCLAAFLYTQFSKPVNTLVFVSIIVAAVLSLHISRQDKAFIFQHLEQPVAAVYTEYLLVTLPFIASLWFTPYWHTFLLMQMAFYGIAHIRISPVRKTGWKILSQWIPPRDFEWIGGMRKAAVWILFFYIAALSLSWLIVAPLVCLWLITIQVTSFYLECEPLSMLWSRTDTPAQLIHSKIKRHCAMLLLLSLPVLLLHSLLCPGMLFISLGFLLAQMLLLVFAILLKYTTYTPGKTITGNHIILGLAALSIAIPFLLPVPFFMSIRNYGRALAQLKEYTYDPHS